MATYRTQHTLRLLSGPADRARLQTALAVYVRTTSPGIRTQSAQIQWRFDNPENRFGEMVYLSLMKGRETVGFAMFGYYPGPRLVIIDHIAIDPAHRHHGSFYVFASLMQQCIEERCPDYDLVAVEVGIDAEFAGDGPNGRMLVRLLRQVGFGRVHVDYVLPSLEAKGYRKPHAGSLMLRGSQPLGEIRREVLLGLHQAILFEHYLPWFEGFFDKGELETYRAQLSRLSEDLKGRLKASPTLIVNGPERDELMPKPHAGREKLFGVELATVGHLGLFAAFLSLLVLESAVLRPEPRVFAVTVVLAAVVYLALAAQSGRTGLKVFERFGSMLVTLFSGM